MTKCRCFAVLAAFGLLAVWAVPNAESADQPQMKCPRVGEACDQSAAGCYHEFTVKNDDKKGSLDVTYPNSVFAVTKYDGMSKEEVKREEAYVKEAKSKVYGIAVKQGTVVTEGHTYAFKRCKGALYERGEEVDPNHK